MKNLHYFRKFAVLVMSAMMVLTTFALPTFAATPTSFTVGGLEEGVKATAYRIVVQEDDSKDNKGATKLVVADSIANVEKPTQEEIMALVPEVQKSTYAELTGAQKLGPVTVAENANTATFTGASSGMYLVIFENSKDAEYIYNPVIVSINYDDEEAQTFTTGGKFDSNGYAKKSKVPFHKVVERSTDFDRAGKDSSNAENDKTQNDEALVDADGYSGKNNTNEDKESNNDGNLGDTAAGPAQAGKANVGDTVTFRINSTVPAYADNFFMKKGYLPKEGTNPVEYNVNVPGANTNLSQDPEFVVYDSMTGGLTLTQNSVKVYEANTNNPIDEALYTIKYNDDVAGEITTESAAKLNDGDKFVVVFKPEAIAKYRGQGIEIRYNAKVNGTHGVNFDGEKNTGGVDFSRNPGEAKKQGYDETTHHYTFTINGKVDGNNSIENREVLKVGVDESGAHVFKETEAKKETGWEPLNGVTFKLYKKIKGATTAAEYKNAEVVRTAVSDKDGLLRGMDRIDAGEYVLIETNLGEGTLSDGKTKYKEKYNVVDTPIEVKIEAHLDPTTGRLNAYEVYVGGICVGHYQKNYTADNPGTEGTIEYLNDAGEVLNTHHKCEIKAGETTTFYKMKDGKKVYGVDDEFAYDYDQDAAHIRNSYVGTLPSTGGMGTVLFTVAGAAIMALALLLLFGGKKKKSQAQK